MIALRITVTPRWDNNPALARLASKLKNRKPLMARMGGELNKLLRAHFIRRDKEGNKKGWPRSHFWKKVVHDATAVARVTETTATVRVASYEFAHKVKGGNIRPKRKRALAIPLTAKAAKAGSPRLWKIRFPDNPLFRPKGWDMLFAAKGKKSVIAHYLLRNKVKQFADPRAMPDMKRVRARLVEVASDWLLVHYGRRVKRRVKK